MIEFIDSPNYSRAPITDAILQWTFQHPIAEKHLRSVSKALKVHYPDSKLVKRHEFRPNGDSFQSSGFRLSDLDQTDLVMLNSRALIVGRSAPYAGWNSLSERAKIVRKKWTKFVPSHQLRHIGVRYTNRIDVPIDNEKRSFSSSDYLNVKVSHPIPSDLPMTNLLAKIVMRSIIPEWQVSVTTQMAKSPVPKHGGLILDIDVSRSKGIPNKEDDMLALFAEARKIKNDVFERCITDCTRELIS